MPSCEGVPPTASVPITTGEGGRAGREGDNSIGARMGVYNIAVTCAHFLWKDQLFEIKISNTFKNHKNNIQWRSGGRRVGVGVGG